MHWNYNLKELPDMICDKIKISNWIYDEDATSLANLCKCLT